jgi:hypothetical protein
VHLHTIDELLSPRCFSLSPRISVLYPLPHQLAVSRKCKVFFVQRSCHIVVSIEHRKAIYGDRVLAINRHTT